MVGVAQRRAGSITTNVSNFAKLASKTVVVLISIYISLYLVPHTTTIKEICFYSSVLITAGIYLSRKLRLSFSTPLTEPFLLLLIWSIVSYFFALNKPNSLHDIFAHFVKYLALYFILVNFFKDRVVSVSWNVILCTTAYAVYIITYYYFVLGNDFSTMLGLEVAQVTRNIVGMASVFPFILTLSMLKQESEKGKRLVLYACLLVLLIMLLLTQCRGALIALTISAPIVLWKNRKMLAGFAGLLVIAAVIMPVSQLLTIDALVGKIKGDDRVKIAHLFKEVVKDYPVTGIGFGFQTYDDAKLLAKYNAKLSPEYRQNVPIRAPHNILLDVAVRLGLPGLVLFLFMLFRFLGMSWDLIRNRDNEFSKNWGIALLAAFIAFFAQGMLENVLSGPPALILFIIFAMMTNLWQTKNMSCKLQG